MSLLTNVHAENRSERRLSVFTFNLIIFIMSFVILAAYTALPFFTVKASAEFTKEMAAEFIPLEDENVDIGSLINDGVELKLEIVIPAEVALDTAASLLNRIIFYFDTNVDLNDTITTLVDKNINSLVDQLLPALEDIAVNATKQLAVTKGKDALLNALTGGNAEQNAEFEQKLIDAGIDDAYLEGKMTEVTDALQAENATPETVADTVVDVMKEIVTDLQSKEDPALNGIVVDDLDNAELKQEIVTMLENFKNEDGNIDFDAAMAEMLNKFLSGNETAQAKGDVILLALPLNEEETDAVAELKLNVRNELLGLLGEDAHRTIGIALKIASLVLIFSMATWVYLMIKIIAKLFSKDNTVKFKVPILFGGLPGLLWLVPSLVLHFLSKNPALVDNPYNLDLSFAASGWIAILGAVVLIIISAPYSALRNELRGKKLRKFK